LYYLKSYYTWPKLASVSNASERLLSCHTDPAYETKATNLFNRIVSSLDNPKRKDGALGYFGLGVMAADRYLNGNQPEWQKSVDYMAKALDPDPQFTSARASRALLFAERARLSPSSSQEPEVNKAVAEWQQFKRIKGLPKRQLDYADDRISKLRTRDFERLSQTC
jgi:hypothetical protein